MHGFVVHNLERNRVGKADCLGLGCFRRAHNFLVIPKAVQLRMQDDDL
jgi:hypothetical protein